MCTVLLAPDDPGLTKHADRLETKGSGPAKIVKAEHDLCII